MVKREYTCQACGLRTEERVSIKEAIRQVCFSCGGRLRQILGVPTVVFKGEDWVDKKLRRSKEAKKNIITNKPGGRGDSGGAG